ncbi:epoxide hydrolase family protein [Microbacterium sp. P04]|uniref:epoxide hydrolase family protein n=1 Tax=Microbacterium sp. P04 TaxID=3366947 RepID=UPI003746A84E
MSIPTRADQSVLDDLRDRLERTRWVAALPDDAGGLGVDRSYLRTLIEAWGRDYDWRSSERAILARPWVSAGGDTPINAVHHRAGEAAPTVVLLHGWPDSLLRFDRVVPLLAGVNVVVPALPGYPFSAGPMRGTSDDVADQLDAMMTELGYDRFVVSGGDIGSGIAERWASRHPDRVAALHLTDVPYSHAFAVNPADLGDEERRYLDEAAAWRSTEGAYALEQSTKPNTLAVGLGDSPAGLAAWLVEKLTTWSDSGGDVESVFPRDDLLTWLSAYWVTGSIGTSFAPYAARTKPLTERITVPTAFSLFPKDLISAPRAFGERFFTVVHWTEYPAGGHFGAWEHPEWFVEGLRAALAASGADD